jgi:hypothetical protein
MIDHEPADTAWRIHGALTDWTGKVDAKASFALTLETAVLAGIITLTGSGHHLHALHGFATLTFFWIGIVLLVGSGLASASVVLPQVRRSKVDPEADQNFIFFGHLKSWTPGDLETALQSRDVLPVLSRQLVVMSKIAWKKHAMVQISMTAALVASVLLLVAYAVM